MTSPKAPIRADVAFPLHAEVPAAAVGRRLDQVMAELFPDYSRSRLSAWIKSGDALLDGESVIPRHTVLGGEQIQRTLDIDAVTDIVEAIEYGRAGYAQKFGWSGGIHSVVVSVKSLRGRSAVGSLDFAGHLWTSYECRANHLARLSLTVEEHSWQARKPARQPPARR